jgi:Kef-type K+ transport system membrane component KefB/voltage-gated potassium channel Kch
MTGGFFELAIVILIAAVLGVAAKLLRQPIMLAYLITGIIIAYAGFFNIQNHETFQLFSDLGIMFLLFLVGLEINYSSLRLVGRAALIIGLAQIILTFGASFFLAQFFHFNYLEAAYLAIALTFSSTVIVVKLLSEKRDLSSLYGKLSVGLLLIQDFVAVLLLVFLAGIEAGAGPVIGTVLFSLFKAAGLFILMLYLGRKILPSIFGKVARSPELLFLIGLAWVFFLATLVGKIGFPIEIAGLLAGLALANSSEHFQLAGRVRPLRDFFILIFFVILGAKIVFADFGGLVIPIIVFSLFVLIVKPLIIFVIMGIMRYRKRTIFLTGLTTAQISEFSLILAALGLKLGHISGNVSSLLTAVAIITITASAYFITHANKGFGRLSRFLLLFERRLPKEDGMYEKEFKKPVILIGGHRTGLNIAMNIPAKDLLVIDFDPEVINQLRKRNIDYIFGDIADPEIFEKANFGSCRLLISTSPDLEDNLLLLSQLSLLPKRPKTIIRAEDEKEAKILYDHGADYALLPHFTAGQYLGKTIAIDPEMKILEQLKKKDLEQLASQRF